MLIHEVYELIKSIYESQVIEQSDIRVLGQKLHQVRHNFNHVLLANHNVIRA